MNGDSSKLSDGDICASDSVAFVSAASHYGEVLTKPDQESSVAPLILNLQFLNQFVSLFKIYRTALLIAKAPKSLKFHN